MNLTGAACRAARAILRWSTEDLARHSGVATTTINRLENDHRSRAGTRERLVEVFRANGVELFEPPADGVRRIP